jgi:hypothetical protein
MDRLILTLAIVAFFALCVGGMWLGWRRKARSQSVLVPIFPEVPANPGELVLPELTGLYVSTTTAGHWQDRVVTRGAGMRSTVTLRLRPGGVELDRGGAPGFWIPAEALAGVRRDKQIAGKVMGIDSLLVITWQAGEVLLDTGILGDDLDVYPQWIEEISAAAPQDRPDRTSEIHPSEINGGAQ